MTWRSGGIREGFDADGTTELTSNTAHRGFRVGIAVMHRRVQVRVVQRDGIDICLGQQAHCGGKLLLLNPPSNDLHLPEKVFRLQSRRGPDCACDPLAARLGGDHVKDMTLLIPPTEFKQHLLDDISDIGLRILKGLVIHFQLAFALHAGARTGPTHGMRGAVPLGNALNFAVCPRWCRQYDALRENRHFLSFSHKDIARRKTLRRRPQTAILIVGFAGGAACSQAAPVAGVTSCRGADVLRLSCVHGLLFLGGWDLPTARRDP